MGQLRRWNRWYDELPELLRFPVVLGLLVIVGAINLALTIATRFPFGLLVLLAIAVLAAIRLPYLVGPDNPARSDWGEPEPAAPEPSHGGLMSRANHWYESFPELWRFQLIVWALVLVGAVNLALTLAVRLPFGLLVLIAVVVIAAIRLPYLRGRGHAAPAIQPTAREPPALEPSPPPRTEAESAPPPIPLHEAALPPQVEHPPPAA